MGYIFCKIKNWSMVMKKKMRGNKLLSKFSGLGTSIQSTLWAALLLLFLIKSVNIYLLQIKSGEENWIWRESKKKFKKPKVKITIRNKK